MSVLREADFYYGAALSKLANKKIYPILKATRSDRQVYKFVNGGNEYILYLKYRSEQSNPGAGGMRRWQFTFDGNEVQELKRYMRRKGSLLVGLVCGTEKLKDSEYVVLREEDVMEIFAEKKTSIAISRKTRERYYRIFMGGGRNKSKLIPVNRLY